MQAGFAYNVYTTDGDPTIPLRWFSDTVEYVVSDISIPEVETAALITIAQQGFGAWQESADCTPILRFAGTTAQEKASFTVGCENENTLVFLTSKSAWSQQGHSSLEIGKTTLMFSEETGEIVDADIELNAGGFTFSTSEVTEGSIDLLNTVTHEVGHFLGMDHSLDKEATMYAQAPPEETKKRSLEDDDLAGVCFLYENFDAPESYYDGACNPDSPDYPDVTAEQRPDTNLPVKRNTQGCSSHPAPMHPLSSLFVILLLFHVMVWRRQSIK